MSHDPLFLTSGLLGGLGDLATCFINLGNGLDDTDGNSLDVDVSGRTLQQSEWTRTCLMSRTAKRPSGG